MSAELLLRCPLFRDFSPVGLEILAGLARIRPVLAGQALFVEGEESAALFVLLEGRLRLSALGPDGNPSNVGVLEPYEPLGQVSLLSEAPTLHLCTAVAEGDCRVLELPRDAFRDLQPHKPQACTKLLLAIAGDLAARVSDSRSVLRSTVGRGPGR